MPFTLAHPAAAVPLCRPLGRFGVMSALILGSLTPDLWYLLPLSINRNDSHSIAGLFWFCLPFGLALYVLYHLVLKHPLVSLLPSSIACRCPLQERPRLPVKPWSAVTVSLLVGAMTHSTWDSFTHTHGRALQALPLLAETVFSIGSHEISAATMLQYGSGLVGLLLLAWWTWRWASHAPRHDVPVLALSPGVRALVLTALLAAALGTGFAVGLRETPSSGPDLSIIQTHVRPAIYAALQAVAAALLVYSAAWHAWLRRYDSTARESA